MSAEVEAVTEAGTIDPGRLHVVLGAGGGTGGAIVRELVGQGRRVRAVTRGGRAAASYGTLPPASFEDVAADVTEREQLRRALAGADVVYHCAQPAYTRWPQEFPAMTRGIAGGRGGSRCEAGVRRQSLHVRAGRRSHDGGDAADGADEEGQGARRHGRRAARRRTRTARCAWSSAAPPTTSARAGSCPPSGERFFKAVLAGKKAQWFADLDQPHTLSYLPDMARAFVVLGERPEADGQVWHTPAAPALTGRQYVELAARAAGTPAKPAVLGRGTVRTLGLFMPVLREFPELMYQYDRPFVMDASKFEAAFGPFAVTPHEEALRTTLEWFRGRG